jgi:hypothetical protein
VTVVADDGCSSAAVTRWGLQRPGGRRWSGCSDPEVRLQQPGGSGGVQEEAVAWLGGGNGIQEEVAAQPGGGGGVQ